MGKSAAHTEDSYRLRLESNNIIRTYFVRRLMPGGKQLGASQRLDFDEVPGNIELQLGRGSTLHRV
jgi:hypothetical protein